MGRLLESQRGFWEPILARLAADPDLDGGDRAHGLRRRPRHGAGRSGYPGPDLPVRGKPDRGAGGHGGGPAPGRLRRRRRARDAGRGAKGNRIRPPGSWSRPAMWRPWSPPSDGCWTIRRFMPGWRRRGRCGRGKNFSLEACVERHLAAYRAAIAAGGARHELADHRGLRLHRARADPGADWRRAGTRSGSTTTSRSAAARISPAPRPSRKAPAGTRP